MEVSEATLIIRLTLDQAIISRMLILKQLAIPSVLRMDQYLTKEEMLESPGRDHTMLVECLGENTKLEWIGLGLVPRRELQGTPQLKVILWSQDQDNIQLILHKQVRKSALEHQLDKLEELLQRLMLQVKTQDRDNTRTLKNLDKLLLKYQWNSDHKVLIIEELRFLGQALIIQVWIK